MAIFWCLILSHFLADFTFQTNFIAKWKDKSIWGRLSHVFIFLAITFIITFPALDEIWIIHWPLIGTLSLYGWFCVVVLTVLHLAEDQFRIWCVHERKLSNNSFFFAYDQLVHVSLIILFTPWSIAPSVLSIPWMRIGTLLVLCTHFTTIVVFYLEKDIYGHARMIVQEKYMAMAERLVIVLLFFLPGGWWAICIAAWVLFWLVKKIRKGYDRSWVDLGISYSMAIIIGLAIRFNFFS